MNMENNIKLIRIESKDKSILQNLFQLYMHDITASLPMDVNEHGLFEYNYIDYYFSRYSAANESKSREMLAKSWSRSRVNTAKRLPS